MVGGSFGGAPPGFGFDRGLTETASAFKSATQWSTVQAVVKIIALMFIVWLFYQAYMHSALVFRP